MLILWPPIWNISCFPGLLLILIGSIGLPILLSGKESACSAGDLGLIPELEKGMATHSSILAWRIPWTEEESGGLQSMGSQTDSAECLRLTLTFTSNL